MMFWYAILSFFVIASLHNFLNLWTSILQLNKINTSSHIIQKNHQEWWWNHWDHNGRAFFLRPHGQIIRRLFGWVAPKHSMGPSRPTGNPAATARTKAAAPRRAQLQGFFKVFSKGFLYMGKKNSGSQHLTEGWVGHLTEWIWGWHELKRCLIVSWLTCAHGTPGQFFASFASGCQTKPSLNFPTKDLNHFKKDVLGFRWLEFFMSLLSFAKRYISLRTFCCEWWFMCDSQLVDACGLIAYLIGSQKKKEVRIIAKSEAVKWFHDFFGNAKGMLLLVPNTHQKKLRVTKKNTGVIGALGWFQNFSMMRALNSKNSGFCMAAFKNLLFSIFSSFQVLLASSNDSPKKTEILPRTKKHFISRKLGTSVKSWEVRVVNRDVFLFKSTKTQHGWVLET